jgi:DNA-binding CsgD family transcriptional regulator
MNYALFERSLLPVLVADDDRRYVDANQAACLFMRLPRDRLLTLRVDDLTPPENRHLMETLWRQFMADGIQGGLFELVLPDGHRTKVPYSATANFTPGCHVSVLDPFSEATDLDYLAIKSEEAPGLSEREREVLGAVALGETSQSIAAALHISVTTVDTHIRNSLAKLSARNRPHAVLLALRRGEIAVN